MNSSRILVTGANGFVGHQLCEELVKLDFPVSAASRAKESLNIIGCDVIKVPDIDAYTDWTAALSEVDTVIHLAARVHVMHDDATNPLDEFLKVNLHGTVSLARQAANAGVRRFVYVSSIKVNGEYTIESESFTETCAPNPQDPYAISKLRAEHALQVIGEETGMEIVIIRPPLIYGPGVKANFLNLIKLVDRSLPLPLGDIHNSRSMVYVGNIVSALVACATHGNAANQLYLVSDGENVSTPQLVAKISTALNRRNRIFYFPIFLIYFAATLFGKRTVIQRLTQSLIIDSAKIRKELGWQPPFTLTDGLKITADWYKQNSN
ncbi:MAG TPA: SDR family oxidoreductase [Methylotenera sp.]|nr:SDR family oxidoreductase [Methylotenera sp.]